MELESDKLNYQDVCNIMICNPINNKHIVCAVQDQVQGTMYTCDFTLYKYIYIFIQMSHIESLIDVISQLWKADHSI